MLKKLLFFVSLCGCGLVIASPIHSIYQRDVSHLVPPATSYGVPDARISAPYPPAVPVQEYGPPQDAPVEPINEYGPPPEPVQEYGPPPEPVQEYGPPAKPVEEYGPPAVQQDVVAPVEQYGPPAEAIQDSQDAIVTGPYPPARP